MSSHHSVQELTESTIVRRNSGRSFKADEKRFEIKTLNQGARALTPSIQDSLLASLWVLSIEERVTCSGLELCTDEWLGLVACSDDE